MTARKQYRPPIDGDYRGAWDRTYTRTRSTAWREAAADMLLFQRNHRELQRAVDCMQVILRAVAQDPDVHVETLRRLARRQTGIERFDFDDVFAKVAHTGIFGALRASAGDRQAAEAQP